MTRTLAIFIGLVVAVLTGCSAISSQKWTATATPVQQSSDPFYDSKYSPL